MACKIHNVRFYAPKPEAIHCMAYESNSSKLAVVRADVSIEIWNLNHAPFIERTLTCAQNSSCIQALSWYGGRLFSVGLEGFLIEYDLKTLSQRSFMSVTGEAAYCVDIHKNGQIAIGTEQGYLNLFQAIDDEVHFEKFLDKQEGRILCVKYDASGGFVVSGSVGAVRVWDVKTGQALHRMTTGRALDNSETIVWCISVLNDMTIVTGDSRGKLTFWDGKIGAQIEEYQSHEADILALVVSDDQKSLYCAGTDPTIVSYVKVNVKSESHKWVKSIQRRLHDHDVRSLVLCGTKVYSGGTDGYLACSYYPPKTLLKYPPILQSPCVSVSAKRRFLLLRYAQHVEMWLLGQCDGRKCRESYTGTVPLVKGPKKLLELTRTVKDDDGKEVAEGITCCAVSENGGFVAYSTSTAIRLFEFEYDDINKPTLNVINTPKTCGPSYALKFSPHSDQLVTAPLTGGLQILSLDKNCITSVQTLDTNPVLSDVVSFLDFSSCNTYMVTTDTQSNVGVWKRRKGEWESYCKLPKYSAAPTAVAVQPNSCNLWVAYADHKIVEFDLERKMVTKLSKHLGKKIDNIVHRAFCIRNVTFDPRKKNIVILHDGSSMVIVNTQKKQLAAEAKIPKIASDDDDGSNFALTKRAFHSIKKYKHLVHLEWVSDDEMIAVEVSPLSLLEQLPPCLKRNTFGTK